LAREACEIEIEILKKPIGIQDQYIASYGGLRFFEFTPEDIINCRKIELNIPLMRKLNENFLLFYTGVTRSAAAILVEQKDNIHQRKEVLRRIKEMAYFARDELLAGNLDNLGYLLHESWSFKKQLASNISNGEIDEIYETALRAGALGGKITGAGGGGFLLLYCPYEKQEAVRSALHMLQELPFQLEQDGSKVIFDYRR
jgi:D-glycero-alpha-D-manno-heptose-7-phosphate kinase